MKHASTPARIAALAALALATAPAFAHEGRWHIFNGHSHQGAYLTDRIAEPSNAIHSGALDPSDQALADSVADAFQRDPALYGATATISAKNGRVSLSGSSKNVEQSAHAEMVARRVAGVGSVTGTLDPMGS